MKSVVLKKVHASTVESLVRDRTRIMEEANRALAETAEALDELARMYAGKYGLGEEGDEFAFDREDDFVVLKVAEKPPDPEPSVQESEPGVEPEEATEENDLPE